MMIACEYSKRESYPYRIGHHLYMTQIAFFDSRTKNTLLCLYLQYDEYLNILKKYFECAPYLWSITSNIKYICRKKCKILLSYYRNIVSFVYMWSLLYLQLTKRWNYLKLDLNLSFILWSFTYIWYHISKTKNKIVWSLYYSHLFVYTIWWHFENSQNLSSICVFMMIISRWCARH